MDKDSQLIWEALNDGSTPTPTGSGGGGGPPENVGPKRPKAVASRRPKPVHVPRRLKPLRSEKNEWVLVTLSGMHSGQLSVVKRFGKITDERAKSIARDRAFRYSEGDERPDDFPVWEDDPNFLDTFAPDFDVEGAWAVAEEFYLLKLKPDQHSEYPSYRDPRVAAVAVDPALRVRR